MPDDTTRHSVVFKESGARLRRAFPRARLRVRLDGGFAAPEMFDLLVGERMEQARRASKRGGETEHLYGQSRQ